MKLVIDKPSYLKESINIINELVNESRFNITQNGIELISMDAANIAFIHFKLLKNAFSTYQLDKDISIGLNIHNFKQVLRRVKESDFLVMEYLDNRLVVTLKGKTTRRFKIAIIDIDNDEKIVPTLEYKCKFSLDSELFTEAVDVADLKDESAGVKIKVSKTGVKFLTEGTLNESSTEIKASKEVSINCEDEVCAKFNIEYLKKFINGSKISNRVTIHIKDDFPIKVDYKAVDKVMLTFILAPMVENEK